MMAYETKIDLTVPDEYTRSTASRYNCYEKWQTLKLKVDPTLSINNVKIIEQEQEMKLTTCKNVVRFPPETVCLQVRSALYNALDQKKSCVAFWPNYGFFDWHGIQDIIKVHRSFNTAKKVQDEINWRNMKPHFMNPQVMPDECSFEKFLNFIWHTEEARKETIQASIEESISLTCNGMVKEAVIDEVLNILNNQSNENAYILYHPSYTDKKEAERIVNKYLNDETTHIHFVINVYKHGSHTKITDLSSAGSHWTYLSVSSDLKELIYSDSLGWQLPNNMIDMMDNIFKAISNFFKRPYMSRPPKPIEMHCDERRNGLTHKCSDMCFRCAPLQTCGSICGISALLMCALSLSKEHWNCMMHTKNPSIKQQQTLEMIRKPTVYADYLRRCVMAWIIERKVVIGNILSIHESEIEMDLNTKDTKTTDEVTDLKYESKQNYLLKPEFHTESTISRAKENKYINYLDYRIPLSKIGKILFVITGITTDEQLEIYSHFLKKFEKYRIKCVQGENNDVQKEKKQTVLSSSNNNCSDTNHKTDKSHVISLNVKEEKPVTVLSNNEKKQENNERKRTLPVEYKEKKSLVKIPKQTNRKLLRNPILPYQGISRQFYGELGRQFKKNSSRERKRKLTNMVFNENEVIGINKNKKNPENISQTIERLNQECKIEDNRKKRTYLDLIGKTLKFIEDNGPIIKTQDISKFFMKEKNGYEECEENQKTRRICSNEMFEKLSEHANFTQIYVHDTAYILENKNQNIVNTVKNLTQMINSSDNNINQHVSEKLQTVYKDSLECMDTKRDRDILKGILATVTSSHFMAKLEGIKNRKTYSKHRDLLSYNIKEFNNIRESCQIVRTDMTNQQQHALFKRLLEKRKIKALNAIYKGRGRLLKADQFKELPAVLEYCFGEMDQLERAGGGLESHPRLSDAVLYRAVDNNTIMRKAREVILSLAPDDFKISLSTCYNYTQNYKDGTYQSRRHHAGRDVNANISLHAPPRTGVQQFVINLHWSTANVNLNMDTATKYPESYIIDSKDSKSIVCAEVAPVQRPGKTWKRIELLDHDWDQSRTYAVTPTTHLFLESVKATSDKNVTIQGRNIKIKIKRTGQAVSLMNISYFEPETVFRALNEFLLLAANPALDIYFRNPETKRMKENLIFIVDNGPSEAPSNPLVQMCLIRLRKLFNLDKIGQISFAEYHSKRNPVERVHSEENLQLSRHGPFKIFEDGKKIQPGTQEHFDTMEKMADDVKNCVNLGSFGGKNILSFRGVKDQEYIFDDEINLKNFLSLSEGRKDLCEATYTPKKTDAFMSLVQTWGVNEDFSGDYISDYNNLTNADREQRSSWTDKYSFFAYRDDDFWKNDINSVRFQLQPLPDFIQYFQTEELHYLPFDITQRISSSNDPWCKEEAICLPSRVLDLFFKVLPDPPSTLKELIALASWVPIHEVDKFYNKKKSEMLATIDKDKEINLWKETELYKKTKKFLQEECVKNNVSTVGNKIEIVKRLSKHLNLSMPEDKPMYEGDLSSIPQSITAINKLPMSVLRQILHTHDILSVGNKEDLVLRVFMLIHHKGLIFRKEMEGLLNYLQILKLLIKKQYDDYIINTTSVRYIRTYDSSKASAPRKIPSLLSRTIPSVPHPPDLNLPNLSQIFSPLEKYLIPSTDSSASISLSKRLRVIAQPGSTIKMKWNKSNVKGSGWTPGWYNGKVLSYDKETDMMKVEFLSEKEVTYEIKVMESIMAGELEPTKAQFLKLEEYEEIMDIGKKVQIKWTKDELGINMGWTPGWYDAEVQAVFVEEDVITVVYEEEPDSVYTVEVSPSLASNVLRLKK